MADVTLRLAAAGGQATKKELDAVRESARRLGYDTSATTAQATGALGKMGSGIERLAKQGQQLGSVNPVLGSVIGSVSNLGSRLSDTAHVADFLGGSLSDKVAFGANAAGTALIALAAKGVNDFLNLTAQIRGFQRVSGATAEDASKLVFVTHELGVDADSLAKGIYRMSRAVVDVNQPLAAYGVQVARSHNGNVDLLGTLANLSDVYNRLPDQASRNALANAAFGRSGLELEKILVRGRGGVKDLADEAERLGLVFNQSKLTQGKQLSESLRGLEAAGKGLTISLASGVAPAVTDVIQVLTPLTAVLTRTHVLSTALEAFIGVKLAQAFLAAVAAARTWIASLFTVSGAEATAAAGAGELATATTTAGVSGAANMTKLAGAIKGITFIGALVGLEEFNRRLEFNRAQAGRFADRVTAAAGSDIQAQIKALNNAITQQESIRNRGAGGATLSVGGVHIRPFDWTEHTKAANNVDALKSRVADLQAQLKGLGADGSDAFDTIGSAAETAAQKWDKAFTHLDAVRESASATRAYAGEVKKLQDLQKPENSGEVEHAKRVEALTRAQQDSARATRSRQDAERAYAAVAQENVALLQREADATARLADVTVRTSARDATKAAAHVTALQRAGIGGQTLAAAQDEADRLGVTAEQARDDAAKAHESAANVRADHDSRLASAADAVTQAKNAEKDAIDKVAKASTDAQVPAAQLGTTAADLADELNAVVTAARTDWGDRLKAGLVTPQQAAEGLIGTLNSLRALVTDPVLRAELDKIIGGAVTATGETAPPGGGNAPGHQVVGPSEKARGGLSAFIAGGPTLLGERQTGGEAFIPRLGVDHALALGYADTAARWHGGRVVGMAEGGVYGGDGVVRPFGGTTIIRETVKVVTIPQTLVGTQNQFGDGAVKVNGDEHDFERWARRQGVIPKVKAHSS